MFFFGIFVNEHNGVFALQVPLTVRYKSSHLTFDGCQIPKTYISRHFMQNVQASSMIRHIRVPTD